MKELFEVPCAVSMKFKDLQYKLSIIANVVEMGQMINIPKGCQQSGFELQYVLIQSEGALVSDLFYSVSCMTWGHFRPHFVLLGSRVLYLKLQIM